jgi:signal transduction histidine kinase
VTVSARARGSDAVIVVQDQGVGIPADEVDRIFTPYFRASTARGAPGTGLGLAGARAIVEQHGGAIQLHSVEGEGTTVTLTLPLGEI